MLKGSEAKLSFRAIEVFVAIVEEASVTGAARRLGASISAVSLQLANLEKVLGARLIERSAQRFSLTSAGEVFHPRAIRILDEVTAASAALSDTNISPTIQLNISMIEDFDANVLPAWIDNLLGEFPKMRLNFKSGMSHENHSALANRSADMIIAVENIDTADWIAERPVLKDPYILVSSIAASKVATVDQLFELPLIRYSRDLLIGRHIEAQLRRSKIALPQHHEFSSNQAVYAMVDALNGWTITTASAFLGCFGDWDRGMAFDKLQPAALPIPAFSRTIFLYSRRDSLDKLPDAFASHLRNALQDTLVTQCEGTLPFLKDETRMAILN